MATSGPFCNEGYVCFAGSKVSQPNDYIQGRLCKEGNYCSAGSEYPCPGGTFAAVKGLGSCRYCPPGYYCPVGSVNPIDCPTYNYCPQNSATPKICPDGTYTPPDQKNLQDLSQCAPCATGYYCTQGRLDTKLQCEAGYFCLTGAAPLTYKNIADNLCPSGFYCELGALLPTPCPVGLTSLPGSTGLYSCTDCPAGYYCVRG